MRMNVNIARCNNRKYKIALDKKYQNLIKK